MKEVSNLCKRAREQKEVQILQELAELLTHSNYSNLRVEVRIVTRRLFVVASHHKYPK